MKYYIVCGEAGITIVNQSGVIVDCYTGEGAILEALDYVGTDSHEISTVEV